MKVAVKDANVLIDLVAAGLLDLWGEMAVESRQAVGRSGVDQGE